MHLSFIQERSNIPTILFVFTIPLTNNRYAIYNSRRYTSTNSINLLYSELAVMSWLEVSGGGSADLISDRRRLPVGCMVIFILVKPWSSLLLHKGTFM